MDLLPPNLWGSRGTSTCLVPNITSITVGETRLIPTVAQVLQRARQVSCQRLTHLEEWKEHG